MEDLIIKKSRRLAPYMLVLSVLILAASIFCIFLPILNSYDKNIAVIYFAIGIVGTLYFGFLSAYLLFETISPKMAIVLTSEGLFDFTTTGGGAGFIPWNNIADTKLYGRKKSKYLGVNIKTPKKVLKEISKKAYEDIMTNIESGMPALVIKCNEIGITPEELAEMITERRKAFNSGEKSILSDANSDEFTIRREGKATLEDASSYAKPEEIIKADELFIQQPIKTEVKLNTKNKDEIQETNKSIDDILKALNIKYENKVKPEIVKTSDINKDTPIILPLNKDPDVIDASLFEDDRNDNTEQSESKEKPKTYEDYGILFVSDDDDDE
ncbi:MAG: hypothetical protein A2Y17_05650 [Clostridiales bacterium GWF2_38_85]|nr:MAG: hypothetical protein A2Y17_05650 [Clostridiales bacterium GWF2_38_85]HBL84034.1 hypothetical protein [Clostridiales bacterium]